MTVLVTGAAGGVAKLLIPRLGRHVDLRLTDLIDEGTGIVRGDITDRKFLHRLLPGVAAVVHLAGNPRWNAPWVDLLRVNIDGTAAVLEVAAAVGVPKVVLASSVHAVGWNYWSGPRPVTVDRLPRACCAYGASKVTTEALGRLYADAGSLSVICLRLGGCRDVPPTSGWLDNWLSPDDLTRLVQASLATDRRYGVYFGVSRNRSSAFDLSSARAELGYEPCDDSAIFAASTPYGTSTLCRPPALSSTVIQM